MAYTFAKPAAATILIRLDWKKRVVLDLSTMIDDEVNGQALRGVLMQLVSLSETSV